MSLGSGEIYEAAFTQHDDSPSSIRSKLFDKRTHLDRGFRHLAQGHEIKFEIKVSAVTNNRPVFHHRKMFAIDHVTVAGNGYENVPDGSRRGDRHDSETIHHSFHGLNWIDLSDDNVRPHASAAQGHAFATPTIPDDNQRPTSEQNIRRANYPVQRRLTRAVPIVEEMLRLRIVNGYRLKRQYTGLQHSLQTNNAGGCFFGGSDKVFSMLRLFLN